MIPLPDIDIWFEIEKRCNLNCLFCYNYWKSNEFDVHLKQLTSEEIIKGFSKLFKIVNCKNLTLSGGEPLLRKDLFRIIEFLKNQNIKLHITTNGLLINETIGRRLKSSGIHFFEIPLHSMNSEIHNFLCNSNCFESTINAILILKELGCHVVPVFVATSLNIDEIIGVLNFCSYVKINEIIFNRVIIRNKQFFEDYGFQEVPESSILKILLESYNFLKKNNITLHLGVPIKLNSDFRTKNLIVPTSCSINNSSNRWTIDFAGNIRKCNMDQIILGNILQGGEELIFNKIKQNTKLAIKRYCECKYHI